MKVIAWYNRVLSERPLLTKSVTTFFILGTGDLLSQYLEARTKGVALRHELNFTRCANVSFYGALYLAPAMHTWYGFLSRTFPQAGALSVLKKTVCDQTLFCPFAIGSYLLIVTRLNVGRWQAGVETVKNYLWTALLMNWRIWPLVMIINFTFIPLKFQVIFVNSVALFWNAYMSKMTNQSKN